MAYVQSYNSRLLVGSINLTPYLTGASPSFSQEMLEVTTLNDTGKSYIPGLTDHTMSIKGFLDPTGTANLQADQLKSWVALTGGQPVTFAPRGLVGGVETVMINGLAAQLNYGAPVGGVVSFDVNVQSDTLSDYGKVLSTTVPTTSSTNESSSNNGAGTSNGLVAHLHVLAFSGFSGVTVKVQHSTDNSSWSDLVTFTAATGLTSQRSSVSGTVNQYLRASSTVTGTGSISYYVAVARR